MVFCVHSSENKYEHILDTHKQPVPVNQHNPLMVANTIQPNQHFNVLYFPLVLVKEWQK